MNKRKFRKHIEKYPPFPATPFNGTARFIREMLNGELCATPSAFVWASTPQGHAYWRDVCAGRRKISKRTRSFLVKLEKACSDIDARLNGEDFA